MKVSTFAPRPGARCRFAQTLVIAALTLTFMTSCDDDDDHHVDDEHFEAVGLVISVDGTEVLRLQDNMITGSLTLNVDDAVDYSVQFILEDGDIEIPHGDEVLELSIEVDDDSRAEVSGIDSEAYSFTLSGKQEGSADLTVSLLHEGHADYVSLPLPLVVVQ